MLPPSRASRILKWTGVGLCILILGIWLASLRWSFHSYGYRGVGIIVGQVTLTQWAGQQASFNQSLANTPSYQMRQGYLIQQVPTAHMADFRYGFMLPKIRYYYLNGTYHSWELSLPLWLPLLLTAIPTAWLWHRDRRLISCSPDHLLCSGCGYDLTGNTSGVCSECGERRPNMPGSTARNG